MKPHFKPGQKGKAYYSDTNYQLLGKIIEIVTDMTISQALATYVFKPLGLEKTYLYQDSNDTCACDSVLQNRAITNSYGNDFIWPRWGDCFYG